MIAALLAAGYAVQQLDPPLPDLIVAAHGRLLLLEVKDHAEGKATRAPFRRNNMAGLPPSLTEGQAAWWSTWIAAGGPSPVIVLDAAEALAACARSSSA